jgi:lipopolysaccharide export system permease protein
MTFFICLFIVLMQFLWMHVDKFVGKGLGIGLIAELFFYAALSLCPMALPLAVLLASLMTFGNLGESLELTAMKSSGISLFKIMRPLMIFIFLLAIGAFYFQDEVLPRANTKMGTILYGIKNKSPELEIPEGVFYKEIQDYNLYVGHKDFKTGMLYDVLIYIFDGADIEAATVTVADSGRIQMGADGEHLKLTLWSGSQLGTFTDNTTSRTSNTPKYRREGFSCKEVYIPYKNDFERADESLITSRHVGKNLHELRLSVDSLDRRIAVADSDYCDRLVYETYFRAISTPTRRDSAFLEATAKAVRTAEASTPDLDSIYASLRPEQELRVLDRATSNVESVFQRFDTRREYQAYEKKNRSRHEIEIHKKFTLSIACIIFFFIGAPLGAIIRKGGLSVPIIVSVLFFIIYYLIDNTGRKLAENDEWAPWAGVWLSSYVLAPIGIFLTWRAINDSTLFDWDSYRIYFRHAKKKVQAWWKSRKKQK